MRGNNKRQETKIIGIAGAKHRHGCTHLAINMAANLHSLGFKVAVMEDSKSDAFGAIAEECPGKTDIKDGFSYLGVDYFPYKRPRVLPKLMGRSYDFIVMDHGVFSQCDKDFFYSCQPAIISCAGRPWEISDIDEVFEEIQDEEILKGLYYCFHFVPDKLMQKKICSEMGELKNVYFTRLVKNPFSDTDHLVQRLLGLELEGSAEENRPAFSLRPKIPFLFASVSRGKKGPEITESVVITEEIPLEQETGLDTQSVTESKKEPDGNQENQGDDSFLEETVDDAMSKETEGIDAATLPLDDSEENAVEPEETMATEPEDINESNEDEQPNTEVSLIVKEGEMLPEKDETPMEAESLPEEKILVSQPEENLPLTETEVILDHEPTSEEIEIQSSPKNADDSETCQDATELQNPIKEELIFGRYKKEGSDNPHAETERDKYLDTMWFQRCTITCSPKDAYMPEVFEFYIYPLALEKERIPIMTAVGMLHKDVRKTYFSTPNARSAKIEHEEYTFLCTVRFVDGKMVSRIALDSEKYEIIEERFENYKNKKRMPQSFGKVLCFGNDRLEIYPLSLQNEALSGCCKFMYRFQLEDRDISSGLSDDEDGIVVVPNEGGAKRVSCYWTGAGAEKKLSVLLS